jgi:hypothetical protein
VKTMARDMTRWRCFVDALCPIGDNRRWLWWRYKIMSVMSKWLSVDVLCVLFVNVCRHVVYGIISCLRTLWLLLQLRVCWVSGKRLMGL